MLRISVSPITPAAVVANALSFRASRCKDAVVGRTGFKRYAPSLFSLRGLLCLLARLPQWLENRRYAAEKGRRSGLRERAGEAEERAEKNIKGEDGETETRGGKGEKRGVETEDEQVEERTRPEGSISSTTFREISFIFLRYFLPPSSSDSSTYLNSSSPLHISVSTRIARR